MSITVLYNSFHDHHFLFVENSGWICSVRWYISMEKSFFFHFYSKLVFFYKSWFIWLLYKNFDFTNFACFLSNFVARLSSKLGRHIRSSIWVDLKWRTKREVLIWMPNGKWHLGFERTTAHSSSALNEKFSYCCTQKVIKNFFRQKVQTLLRHPTIDFCCVGRTWEKNFCQKNND